MAGPQLTATLRASLEKFEDDMAQAGRIADKAVNEIEQAFASANPRLNVSNIVKGLGGLAALAIMQQLGEQVANLNRQFVELGEAARRAGMHVERFQEIQFAAGALGVPDKDIEQSLDRVNSRLNDAMRNENSLTKLLDANNIKYKDRNGQLITMNQLLTIAADLVRRAATEQDKFKIADMLGFSESWVRALEKGSGVIEDLATQFRQSGLAIDENTIKKAEEFTRRWDSATKIWALQFKAALAEILPGLNTLVEKASGIIGLLGQGGNIVAGFGRAVTGGLAGLDLEDLERMRNQLRATHGMFLTGDENKRRKQHAEEIRLLEILEDRIQAVRNQNAELADQGGPNRGVAREITRLTVTGGPPTRVPADERPAARRDALEVEEDRIRRRIAVMEAETEAIGLNEAARERMRIEATLMDAARRAEIADTEVLRERVKKLADEYEDAARRAQMAREIMSETKAIGSLMADAFKAAVIEGQKLDEVLKNLLNRLASRSIDRLFDIAFNAIGGALARGFVGPGGGVLLGGLPLGQGGIGSAQHGGPVRAGRPVLVGERGPELLVPRMSGFVVPNNQLGGMTFSPTTMIDARGSTLTEGQMAAIIAQGNAQLYKRIKQDFPGWQDRQGRLGRA